MVAVRLPVAQPTRVAVTSYMVKMDRRLREGCAPKTIFTSLRVSWSLKNQISIVLTRKSLGFHQIKLSKFSQVITYMIKIILTTPAIEFQPENANTEVRI